MRKSLAVVFILFICWGISPAQTGIVPITLTVGPTAGIAVPVGDLSSGVSYGTSFSQKAKLGWTAGVAGRLGGLLPIDLNASFTYTKLGFDFTVPAGITAPDYKLAIWSLAVGPEIKFPSPGATPYIGADLMYNMIGVDSSGTTSNGRFGLGLGAGVQIMGLDVQAKYQFLNLVGKDTGELNDNLLVVRLAYLFSVL